MELGAGSLKNVQFYAFSSEIDCNSSAPKMILMSFLKKKRETRLRERKPFLIAFTSVYGFPITDSLGKTTTAGKKDVIHQAPSCYVFELTHTHTAQAAGPE